LSQREPFAVIVWQDPPPIFDEVAMHVAGEGDGTAEPHCAELQEVQDKLPQRGSFRHG
jgi:hypothetical protein